MARQIERARSKPPILRRVTAGLVLVVIAVLAVHLALGLIMTVFWIALIVAVVAAAVWAARTLF
jgi:uncharacterized membrane protein